MRDVQRRATVRCYSLRCLRRRLFTYFSYQNFVCFSLRFAARLFAYAFLMLISFMFSCLENIFVVFYLSFYFVLARSASALEDNSCACAAS